MRKNAHSTVYREEARLFYAALVFMAAVFIAYIYFVSISVADVVMRKEVDEKIAEMATTISALESEYIEMQHSLSTDIAEHRGFVAVDTKVFIDTSDAGTLVLRGD